MQMRMPVVMMQVWKKMWVVVVVVVWQIHAQAWYLDFDLREAGPVWIAMNAHESFHTRSV
jgi:hypothetical protein